VAGGESGGMSGEAPIFENPIPIECSNSKDQMVVA
jgi:hypothetical protein